MRDRNRPQSQPIFGLDQALDPVRDGVEGVEDVEEPGAGREWKVGPEGLDAADGQENAERWPECVERRKVNIQSLKEFKCENKSTRFYKCAIISIKIALNYKL